MGERFAYDTGRRPRTQADGTIVQVWLAWCVCTPPQGLPGGVCTTCAGAIYQPPTGERAVEVPQKDATV